MTRQLLHPSPPAADAQPPRPARPPERPDAPPAAAAPAAEPPSVLAGLLPDWDLLPASTFVRRKK